MIKFPVEFLAYAEATKNISTKWNGQSKKNSPIEISIPVEFSGPGDGYSPEELFALSIISCIIGEFKSLCAKNNQSFETIKGKAKLTVNNHTNRMLHFTSLDLFFEVCKSSNIEEIKTTLTESINHCPICNIVKIPKTISLDIK